MGGREQSEGAEREKSRRSVGDWAEAGWRLGGVIYLGLIDWLID